VGERLITVNPSVLNTPGFRAAGWLANPADIKRTYSPPIPTGLNSEYFQAPPRSAGVAPTGYGDEEEEAGGLVTGGRGSGDTIGPGLIHKRRRRRELREDDDSSDLSDDSDDDSERTTRYEVNDTIEKKQSL
jgi:target of rapamycin complex 2 subunit MAPKAP1